MQPGGSHLITTHTHTKHTPFPVIWLPTSQQTGLKETMLSFAYGVTLKSLAFCIEHRTNTFYDITKTILLTDYTIHQIVHVNNNL